MSSSNGTRLGEFTERLAGQLVELMQTYGPGDWVKPWRDAGCVSALCPKNATTGRNYHGSNVWQFAGVALEQGYQLGAWATYKQWQGVGAQVRRGEKGTPGIKWAPVTKTTTDDSSGDVVELTGTRMVPRFFTVFNVAQVDGYETAPVETWDPVEYAEGFFAGIGADVRHGGDRAYYASVQDYIGMPGRGQFTEPTGYYATLAHEHIHWTGHASRLDRDLRGRFGSEAYAWEELVAELGSVVLCALLGIETTPRPDHAAYLSSWTRGLTEQPKALMAVTSKASDAVEHLEALAGRTDMQTEQVAA